MTEYTDIDWPTAREIVQDAKDNDKVIRLDRIGGTPYLAYTPHKNNRGATVHMWSCLTYKLRRRPNETLIGMPTIVEPWNEETWEVNHISTPWVVNQVQKSRMVKVVEKDDSPFAGGIVGEWIDG